MKQFSALLLSLTLLTSSMLSTTVSANEPPAESSPMPQLQQLLGELMNNVDMALMVRIQQTVMQNFDLIAPYSQEYFSCLKAEGAFDGDEPIDLKHLLDQAKKTKDTCQVILESLFGQMKFDITQQEFEEGLSPEYRQMLKESL